MRSLSLICALTCLFAACVSEDFDVDNPDLADTKNDEYYTLSLGETISGLSVTATRTPADPDADADLQAVIDAETDAAFVVLKLELLAGQAAVIIMKAESDKLNPELEVRAGTYPNVRTVTKSNDSALLGSLSIEGSVVSLSRAGTYYILASGHGLATSGRFSVRAVAVSAELAELAELTTEYLKVSPERRKVLSGLQSDWSSLQDFIRSGFVEETENGLRANANVWIKYRSSVNKTVEVVNAQRALLHAFLGEPAKIVPLMQPVYQAMSAPICENRKPKTLCTSSCSICTEQP